MWVVGEGMRPAAGVGAFLWGQGWDMEGLGAPAKAPVRSPPPESQQGAEPGHRAPQEEDV